ncbi:unnamed protein product, partial [marine sediment metagenome]
LNRLNALYSNGVRMKAVSLNPLKIVIGYEAIKG